MQTKATERYFFFTLLLLVLVFSVIIFAPFLTVLVLGAAFAVVFYPIFNWFNTHVTRGISWISALLTTIIFLVAVCGPLFTVGTLVYNETSSLYERLTTGGGIDPFLHNIGISIEKILPGNMSFDIESKATEFIGYLAGNIAVIFKSTLSTFFSFLLLILSLFYFLKDGKHWKQTVIALSPLVDTDDQKIARGLRGAINGVIKGYLLIAIVQGLLMGIGLWIFGVPSPALFGVIAGIASLIPSVGTSLVALPVVLYLFATGDNVNAIGFAIWAGVLVGMVDNILSPIVIGKSTKVPPLIILFSVLGGISFMGPVGILVGPLTVSLLYVILSIYKTEFQK